MIFEIDTETLDKINKWIDSLPMPKGGRHISYSFTPLPKGYTIKVTEHRTGKFKDFTDYDKMYKEKKCYYYYKDCDAFTNGECYTVSDAEHGLVKVSTDKNGSFIHMSKDVFDSMFSFEEKK